jgi:hypothetical protein
MTTKEQSADVRRALLLALLLAALWAVMAILRSDVTYHLAPLLIAAVPGLAASADRPPRRSVATRLAGLGLAAALGVTLLLSSLGRLDGPSLLPFGGAATESVLFAVVGGVAAWAFGGGLKVGSRKTA